MPIETSLFPVLAHAFMPAQPQRRGIVLEASLDWSFDPASIPIGIDVVIWGRAPDGSSPISIATRRALTRELTLRTLGRRIPSCLSIAAVHRLPPRQLGSRGFGYGLRAALRSGLLVELTSLPDKARVLDAVVAAAGATHISDDFHAGPGGVIVVRVRLSDGSDAIVRLARAGAPSDPARLADILERLVSLRIPLAPRLRGRGHTAEASWVLEQVLPGQRPGRATADLAMEVAEVCAHFPRSEGPPTAPVDDLLGAAARLPERADPLGRLAADLVGRLQAVPGVLRHGDLWIGNLLVDRGRLSGMIDWDASHPAAVPGADLLQLIATEARKRAAQALGTAFCTRPWRSEIFRAVSAHYWPVIGIRPDDVMLELVAIAWWAAEVHGTLMRLPHRAVDERWVATNVDSVLRNLGY